MAEKNSCVIDSSVLVAYFNPEDSQHAKAQPHFSNFDKGKTAFIISNFIFLETVTILSLKTGRAQALKVGNWLLTHADIQIVHIDPQLQKETWHIFSEINKKDTGFVDCSTLALMRAENINTLLSFDVTDFKPLQKQFHFRLIS